MVVIVREIGERYAIENFKTSFSIYSLCVSVCICSSNAVRGVQEVAPQETEGATKLLQGNLITLKNTEKVKPR